MEIIVSDIIVNEILSKLSSYELLNFGICNKYFNCLCNKYWKNLHWRNEYKKLYIKVIPIVYNGNITTRSIIDYYNGVSLNFIHKTVSKFIAGNINYCILLLNNLRVISIYRVKDLIFNIEDEIKTNRVLLIVDEKIIDILRNMRDYLNIEHVWKHKLNDIVINNMFSSLGCPPIYGILEEGILRIVKRDSDADKESSNRLAGIPIYSKYNFIPWYQYDISSLLSIVRILYDKDEVIYDKDIVCDMIYRKLCDIGHIVIVD